MEKTNSQKRLKYFWKYMLITFLIEIAWFIFCFIIAYFYFPNMMRHISMGGFLVIPFYTAYHTMWKQIEELELFIEHQFYSSIKEDKKVESKVEKIKKIIAKPKKVRTKKKPIIILTNTVNPDNFIVDDKDKEVNEEKF